MALPSLHEIAARYAENLQGRYAALDTQLREAQAKAAQIELERDAAGRATKRLAEFRTPLGGEHQCPRCWIVNEVRSPLRPITSPTDEEDRFQCVTCHETYSMPT